MNRNPLLRRGDVLPLESFDNSYGGLIERKQKKYKSGAKAFGVEGFGMMYEMSPCAMFIYSFFIIFIISSLISCVCKGKSKSA